MKTKQWCSFHQIFSLGLSDCPLCDLDWDTLFVKQALFSSEDIRPTVLRQPDHQIMNMLIQDGGVEGGDDCNYGCD